MDGQGWYQLLRKMKRDHQPQSTNIPSSSNPKGVSKASLQFHEQQSFSHGSVLALNMHPEKNKGLMLVLSRQPGQLRVVNMTTYKTLSYCDGFTGISAYLIHENEEDYSTGLFYRSGFSADGKYIICCVPVNKDMQQSKGGGGHSASQVIEKGMYQLLVWDTYTGHPVTTSLSSNVFHPSSKLLLILLFFFSFSFNQMSLSLIQFDQLLGILVSIYWPFRW
jgi:hypothetical protein